MYNYRKGSC